MVKIRKTEACMKAPFACRVSLACVVSIFRFAVHAVTSLGVLALKIPGLLSTWAARVLHPQSHMQSCSWSVDFFSTSRTQSSFCKFSLSQNRLGSPTQNCDDANKAPIVWKRQNLQIPEVCCLRKYSVDQPEKDSLPSKKQLVRFKFLLALAFCAIH